ncbi:hypothetical protein [Marinobacter sp. LN3S78]|uniref:hypothetical protein n=1 Tax=Marinobacter sp. LN3S78 TaxID=3382300 RepID=UPI00387B3DCF
MNDEKYKNYLLDLGILTKEYAREAISDCNASDGLKDESYKTGYMMGFHRFVSLMQQQAESFGIPLEEIGLADIDEKEFLKYK